MPWLKPSRPGYHGLGTIAVMLPVCIFKTGNKCRKTGRERVVENNEGEAPSKESHSKAQKNRVILSRI